MTKKKKIIIGVAAFFLIELIIAIFVDMGKMPEVGKFHSKTFFLKIPVLGNTFHITTIAVTWLIMLFLILIALILRKNLQRIPGRFQGLMELIVSFFDNLCISSLGEKKLGRKFFGLIMTLFTFIVISNIIGIVPSFWKMFAGKNILPEWFAFDCPTQDINTTLGFGIMVAIVVHFTAIRVKGIKTYILDYFEPMIEIGKLKIPNLFMAPLNIVGEFGKVVSHSFRLFGNIMGGSIIILVVSFLVKQIVMPVGLNFFFGIFQGCIQAFVFSMLALTYVAVMISTD